MTDEIRQVRYELANWAESKPMSIQYLCDLIEQNLRLLAKRSDDTPLRIQTMKNVEELARACR